LQPLATRALAKHRLIPWGCNMGLVGEVGR
jgi:hypothetical protein